MTPPLAKFRLGMTLRKSFCCLSCNLLQQAQEVEWCGFYYGSDSLAKNWPYIRDTQMETAVEGSGQPKAAGSDVPGPRFLGYLVVQFTVPTHRKGKWSSMDISPSLSSVALSEQHNPSAASLLLSLCAHTYLSQLSFILYPSNLSHCYWIIIPPVILSPIPVLHSSSSCLLSVSDSIGCHHALCQALQRLFTPKLLTLCTGNLST